MQIRKESLSSRRAWIEIENGTAKGRKLVCRSPHGERGLKCGLGEMPIAESMSLSSRRAWIEMFFADDADWVDLGRSPHGERGLKYVWHDVRSRTCKSLSSRRAWIEISPLRRGNARGRSLSSRRAWIEILSWFSPYRRFDCRSPHGERGLKSIYTVASRIAPSRSPHGERGLKCL